MLGVSGFKQDIPILITGKPGRMRDSLRVLLQSMPGVNVVGQTHNSAATLKMVHMYHPAFVLLDADLPVDEAFTALRLVKNTDPDCRCLMLVSDVQQRQAALGAGADDVLLKGFPAARLFEVVGASKSMDKL